MLLKICIYSIHKEKNVFILFWCLEIWRYVFGKCVIFFLKKLPPVLFLFISHQDWTRGREEMVWLYVLAQSTVKHTLKQAWTQLISCETLAQTTHEHNLNNNSSDSRTKQRFQYGAHLFGCLNTKQRCSK